MYVKYFLRLLVETSFFKEMRPFGGEMICVLILSVVDRGFDPSR